MPKAVLLEELHVKVIAPAGLDNVRYQAMLRTLRAGRFQKRVREGLRQVMANYPSLKKARIRIER